MDKTKKQIRKSRELKTPLFLYMVKLSSQTERKKKIMYACVWECVCSLSDDLSAFTQECGFVLPVSCLLIAMLEENLDGILTYVVNHE